MVGSAGRPQNTSHICHPVFDVPYLSGARPIPHPAMSPHHVAVITGGASGIGLAAAMRFAGLGMRVCIADIGAERLAEAGAKLASVAKGGAADVMTAAVDVSKFDEVVALEAEVRK